MKIMMGPQYKDSQYNESRMNLLDSNEFDEKYCFLYLPKDMPAAKEGKPGVVSEDRYKERIYS